MNAPYPVLRVFSDPPFPELTTCALQGLGENKVEHPPPNCEIFDEITSLNAANEPY